MLVPEQPSAWPEFSSWGSALFRKLGILGLRLKIVPQPIVKLQDERFRRANYQYLRVCPPLGSGSSGRD